jgi:hypothetical protein
MARDGKFWLVGVEAEGGADSQKGADWRRENPPEIFLAKPAGGRYTSNARIDRLQCGHLCFLRTKSLEEKSL